MNPLIQHKPIILPLFIAGVLACFGFLPKTHAVIPPPDGGYPGFNTAEGTSALQHLTTGVGNTAAGWHSLFANSVGSLNTAIGAGTLLSSTVDNNTATGALALLSDTTGDDNTANGAFALLSNTTGTRNTAVGYLALVNNNGSDNTAVGLSALGTNTTGFSNTAVGLGAGNDVTTADHVICIGHSGANVSNSCYIGQIYEGVIDPATTLAVGMDASERLGTAVSAERFKRDIQPMGATSEAILALKPVMFHYKSDARNTPCFGLVAEHVAEVNPHLVVSDKEGKPLAVRYDQVNAMLLNEFQKEHRKNEEQGATIARLQKEIEALSAGLQKVSAQLDLSKPAPRMAVIANVAEKRKEEP